jgi:hypothetical protein
VIAVERLKRKAEADDSFRLSTSYSIDRFARRPLLVGLFEAIQRRFKQGHQHIEIEQLRAMIRRSLDRLVPHNRSRMDYYDTFQKMIADYNVSAANAEALFAQLVDFAKQLNEEEWRGIRE